MCQLLAIACVVFLIVLTAFADPAPFLGPVIMSEIEPS